MNRYLGITLGTVLVLLGGFAWADTATLLPNASQWFMDNNGKALSNGKVYFYESGTTTPKTTWSDPAKTTPQTNPVSLGSSGRPTNPIYGSGIYRQIVKDQFNNTIWDFDTASTGGGSGGTSPAWSEGVMVGTIIPWANTTLPAKYLYTAGQAVARATYPDLLTAITFSTSILCQSGIATISVSTDISDKVPIGAAIEASCFAPGTTVSAKSSGQLTMSTNATATTSVSAVLFPWGNGDGSTTFNVPDLRGRVIAGRDNMNASVASRLTSTYFGANPDAIGASGGSQSHTLLLAELPTGITSGNASQNITVSPPANGILPVGSSNVTFATVSTATGGNAAINLQGNIGSVSNLSSMTTANSISVTSNNTSGSAHAIVQPTLTSDYIIKALADDLPAGPGVTSIQGMTGAIACAGNAIICTAQTITVNLPNVLTGRVPVTFDPGTSTVACPTCTYYVATIAALKALAVPTTGTGVIAYVQGYYASGDGGEGWFIYNSASVAADNGGTVIAPNVGSGRWLRNYLGGPGSKFNVRWFGAKGDQVTDDTTTIGNALTAAIAAKGKLYLPATTAATCYLATITIPASTVGLSIVGDGKGFGNNAPGSCITSASATATINLNGGTSTPVHNIIVDNLKIYNSSTGDGLRSYNVNWVTYSNLVIYSIGGCGLNLQGTANFHVPNVQSYGGNGNALCIGNNAGAFTNAGPGTIIAGQYSIQGSGGTAVIKIEGDPLGVQIDSIMCSGFGPSMVACVTADGPTAGTPTGSVTFTNYHGESNYNSTTNTMAEFLIGNTHKFGSLTISGGNAWGHGDGIGHYEQDFIKVVAARNVTVTNFIASQLSFPPGFSRSMIRLENTFPAAGDTYSFSGNKADITGTMYSDANGRIPTTYTGGASYNTIFPNGVFGTQTNDNACTGCVGEYTSNSAGFTSLSTGTTINGASLSLTTGDWDITYNGYYNPTNAGTNIAAVTASISTTSATHDFTIGRYAQLYHGSGGGGIVPGLNNPVSISGNSVRASIASTTTFYCVVSSIFTVSTLQGNCFMAARRRR